MGVETGRVPTVMPLPMSYDETAVIDITVACGEYEFSQQMEIHAGPGRVDFTLKEGTHTIRFDNIEPDRRVKAEQFGNPG